MKLIVLLCIVLLNNFLTVMTRNIENAEETQVAPEPETPDPLGNKDPLYDPEHEGAREDQQETTTVLWDTQCQCAVFSTPFPNKTDKPILTDSNNGQVECNADGDEDCITICSLLAKAAKNRGPEILCSILGNYERLQPSIHSRVVCDNGSSWLYSGLTSMKEICCKKSLVVECKPVEENQP